MTWLAVNEDEKELISKVKLIRAKHIKRQITPYDFVGISYIILPKGSIKKLIGRDLSWEDNPVEY